jgi:hypothetical protein
MQKGRRLHKPTLGKWAKMDLRELGWGGVDWIDLTQDRGQWKVLVNTVMNHQVP